MVGDGAPYLDWPAPIPLAHRGGTSTHPENTLRAFEHSVEIGFRYLETDARLTADGVILAFHDENLLRTCGIDANISELTWDEIEPLRIDGTEPIPRLRELLLRFPDARFNIDAKSDEVVEPLLDLVVELDAAPRVCLASFKHRRVRRMRRRLGTGSVTALSQPEVACLLIFGWLPGGPPRAAQVPPRTGRIEIVSGRFVRAAHRRGIPVHVWTIDDPTEIERLLDLGVDGIMSDDTPALRQVFVERGIWIDRPGA